MHEEVVWVRVASVRVAIMEVGAGIALTVVEDDDFVDAKNR